MQMGKFAQIRKVFLNVPKKGQTNLHDSEGVGSCGALTRTEPGFAMKKGGARRSKHHYESDKFAHLIPNIRTFR